MAAVPQFSVYRQALALEAELSKDPKPAPDEIIKKLNGLVDAIHLIQTTHPAIRNIHFLDSHLIEKIPEMRLNHGAYPTRDRLISVLCETVTNRDFALSINQRLWDYYEKNIYALPEANTNKIGLSDQFTLAWLHILAGPYFYNCVPFIINNFRSEKNTALKTHLTEKFTQHLSTLTNISKLTKDSLYRTVQILSAPPQSGDQLTEEELSNLKERAALEAVETSQRLNTPITAKTLDTSSTPTKDIRQLKDIYEAPRDSEPENLSPEIFNIIEEMASPIRRSKQTQKIFINYLGIRKNERIFIEKLKSILLDAKKSHKDILNKLKKFLETQGAHLTEKFIHNALIKTAVFAINQAFSSENAPKQLKTLFFVIDRLYKNLSTSSTCIPEPYSDNSLLALVLTAFFRQPDFFKIISHDQITLFLLSLSNFIKENNAYTLGAFEHIARSGFPNALGLTQEVIAQLLTSTESTGIILKLLTALSANDVHNFSVGDGIATPTRAFDSEATTDVTVPDSTHYRSELFQAIVNLLCASSGLSYFDQSALSSVAEESEAPSVVVSVVSAVSAVSAVSDDHAHTDVDPVKNKLRKIAEKAFIQQVQAVLHDASMKDKRALLGALFYSFYSTSIICNLSTVALTEYIEALKLNPTQNKESLASIFAAAAILRETFEPLKTMFLEPENNLLNIVRLLTQSFKTIETPAILEKLRSLKVKLETNIESSLTVHLNHDQTICLKEEIESLTQNLVYGIAFDPTRLLTQFGKHCDRIKNSDSFRYEAICLFLSDILDLSDKREETSVTIVDEGLEMQPLFNSNPPTETSLSESSLVPTQIDQRQSIRNILSDLEQFKLLIKTLLIYFKHQHNSNFDCRNLTSNTIQIDAWSDAIWHNISSPSGPTNLLNEADLETLDAAMLDPLVFQKKHESDRWLSFLKIRLESFNLSDLSDLANFEIFHTQIVTLLNMQLERFQTLQESVFALVQKNKELDSLIQPNTKENLSKNLHNLLTSIKAVGISGEFIAFLATYRAFLTKHSTACTEKLGCVDTLITELANANAFQTLEYLDQESLNINPDCSPEDIEALLEFLGLLNFNPKAVFNNQKLLEKLLQEGKYNLLAMLNALSGGLLYSQDSANKIIFNDLFESRLQDDHHTTFCILTHPLLTNAPDSCLTAFWTSSPTYKIFKIGRVLSKSHIDKILTTLDRAKTKVHQSLDYKNLLFLLSKALQSKSLQNFIKTSIQALNLLTDQEKTGCARHQVLIHLVKNAVQKEIGDIDISQYDSGTLQLIFEVALAHLKAQAFAKNSQNETNTHLSARPGDEDSKRDEDSKIDEDSKRDDDTPQAKSRQANPSTTTTTKITKRSPKRSPNRITPCDFIAIKNDLICIINSIKTELSSQKFPQNCLDSAQELRTSLSGLTLNIASLSNFIKSDIGLDQYSVNLTQHLPNHVLSFVFLLRQESGIIESVKKQEAENSATNNLPFGRPFHLISKMFEKITSGNEAYGLLRPNRTLTSEELMLLLRDSEATTELSFIESLQIGTSTESTSAPLLTEILNFFSKALSLVSANFDDLKTKLASFTQDDQKLDAPPSKTPLPPFLTTDFIRWFYLEREGNLKDRYDRIVDSLITATLSDDIPDGAIDSAPLDSVVTTTPGLDRHPLEKLTVLLENLSTWCSQKGFDTRSLSYCSKILNLDNSIKTSEINLINAISAFKFYFYAKLFKKIEETRGQTPIQTKINVALWIQTLEIFEYHIGQLNKIFHTAKKSFEPSLDSNKLLTIGLKFCQELLSTQVKTLNYSNQLSILNILLSALKAQINTTGLTKPSKTLNDYLIHKIQVSLKYSHDVFRTLANSTNLSLLNLGNTINALIHPSQPILLETLEAAEVDISTTPVEPSINSARKELAEEMTHLTLGNMTKSIFSHHVSEPESNKDVADNILKIFALDPLIAKFLLESEKSLEESDSEFLKSFIKKLEALMKERMKEQTPFIQLDCDSHEPIVMSLIDLYGFKKADADKIKRSPMILLCRALREHLMDLWPLTSINDLDKLSYLTQIKALVNGIEEHCLSLKERGVLYTSMYQTKNLTKLLNLTRAHFTNRILLNLLQKINLASGDFYDLLVRFYSVLLEKNRALLSNTTSQYFFLKWALNNPEETTQLPAGALSDIMLLGGGDFSLDLDKKHYTADPSSLLTPADRVRLSALFNLVIRTAYDHIDLLNQPRVLFVIILDVLDQIDLKTHRNKSQYILSFFKQELDKISMDSTRKEMLCEIVFQAVCFHINPDTHDNSKLQGNQAAVKKARQLFTKTEENFHDNYNQLCSAIKTFSHIVEILHAIEISLTLKSSGSLRVEKTTELLAYLDPRNIREREGALDRDLVTQVKRLKLVYLKQWLEVRAKKSNTVVVTHDIMSSVGEGVVDARTTPTTPTMPILSSRSSLATTNSAENPLEIVGITNLLQQALIRLDFKTLSEALQTAENKQQKIQRILRFMRIALSDFLGPEVLEFVLTRPMLLKYWLIAADKSDIMVSIAERGGLAPRTLLITACAQVSLDIQFISLDALTRISHNLEIISTHEAPLQSMLKDLKTELENHGKKLNQALHRDYFELTKAIQTAGSNHELCSLLWICTALTPSVANRDSHSSARRYVLNVIAIKYVASTPQSREAETSDYLGHLVFLLCELLPLSDSSLSSRPTRTPILSSQTKHPSDDSGVVESKEGYPVGSHEQTTKPFYMGHLNGSGKPKDIDIDPDSNTDLRK